MEFLTDINMWSALLTLTVLEVILGIDNIIFITLMANRLPESQRKSARQVGLLMAMGTRILLLLSIAWVVQLVHPLFHLFSHPVSGRDLILLFGGLFLIYKAVVEIHASLEGHDEDGPKVGASSYLAVILQIALVDIIFSLDSVITAVGLAEQVGVMVTAIVISIAVMMVAAEPIGNFVAEHPTVKMLALSFLVLVGIVLVAEGMGQHMPKGYLYFAIAFSLAVEFLNLYMRKRTKAKKQAQEPVQMPLRLYKRGDRNQL